MSDFIPKYLDRYSKNIDAALFGAVVSIGFIFQLLLRVAFDASALIVTFLMCGLLFFYFWLIIYNSATKQVNERAGDNLYFLGFIFTALTFGVALYKVGSNPELEISSVLSDLGIGLTTTLLGLVLRVWCSLLRTGTEEIETIVHSNLKQQANRLEKRFTYAIQLAEKTSIHSEQLLTETKEALEVVIFKNRNELSDLYTTNFEQTRKMYTMVSEETKKLIEESKASIEQLYEKINDINVPQDFIVDKLARSFDSFENTISNANLKVLSFAELLSDRLNSDADTIETVSNGVKRLHDETEKLASSISNHNIDAQKIEDAINKSSEAYAKAVDSLSIKLASIQIPEHIIRDPIESAINESSDAYSNAITVLSKKLASIEIPKNLISEPIQSAISESSKPYLVAIEGLAEKLSAIDIPKEELVRALREIYSETGHVLTEKASQDYDVRLAEFSKSFDDQTTKLASNFELLNKSLESLSVKISDTSEGLQANPKTTGPFSRFLGS